MWQGWRVHSFNHLFIFHPITHYLIIYSPIGVPLNRAWPTQHWEGSWGCSFRSRTRTQRSVPPKTWRRWVWGGWGRTASCRPGRLGSREAGAGRRSRRRCRADPLPKSSGRARVHCTSSPPSGCRAAACPTTRPRGGRGGRSTRGEVGRWGGEELTPEELRGCCSFPRRPDTGLVLLRQLVLSH